MQNTHNSPDLGISLIELMGVLNSPRGDEVLLREAGVELDRALFPLLVALGARGPLAVGELADLVGRDHTTISRQLAKLASLSLIARSEGAADRRVSTADLTDAGRATAESIAAARRRLLSRALSDWSAADRADLARLLRQFAETLSAFRSKLG